MGFRNLQEKLENYLQLYFYKSPDLFFGDVHKLRLQDLAFFDHLPPSVDIFYGINVDKKSIFLTTYSPPLVNVVCERPVRCRP